MSQTAVSKLSIETKSGMVLAFLSPALILIVVVGLPGHVMQWMVLFLVTFVCGVPAAWLVRLLSQKRTAQRGDLPRTADRGRLPGTRPSGLVLYETGAGAGRAPRSIPVPVDLVDDGDNDDEVAAFFGSPGFDDEEPLELDWSAGMGDEVTMTEPLRVEEDPGPVVPSLKDLPPLPELRDTIYQSAPAEHTQEIKKLSDLEPLHVCLATPSYRVQQTAIAMIDLHGAEKIFGPNLSPFLGDGTGRELISLSLVADVIRLLEIGIGLNRPTGEVLSLVAPLANSFVVALSILGRHDYMQYINPTSERLFGFLREHSNDTRPFGGASVVTCWAGLQICENSARSSRSTEPLDEYVAFQQSATDAFSRVDLFGSSIDSTLVFLRNRIDRVREEINDLDRSAQENGRTDSPESN